MADYDGSAGQKCPCGPERAWLDPTRLHDTTPLRHPPDHQVAELQAAKPLPSPFSLLRLPSAVCRLPTCTRCVVTTARRVRCTVCTPQPTRRHGTRPRPAGPARRVMHGISLIHTGQRAGARDARQACLYHFARAPLPMSWICLDGIFLRNKTCLLT
jgi:hypothetical protein